MTIEDEEKKTQGKADYLIYSNLDELEDSLTYPPSLHHYQAILKKLDIHLPVHILHELVDDALANVGNKVVWHNPRRLIL